MESFTSRLEMLKSSGRAETLLAAIPSHECTEEKSYLEGNDDFYFAYMFSDLNSQKGEICPTLIKHLNDCYRCFEIFTDAMRDFLRKQQQVPCVAEKEHS